ncbi:TetR family transcriptional regulator [Actinosynnema sp. NPDC020468]|uniref:TetR/AcrR family transcriptional regulator n=1 Tax=Actinosynnema sp. NPDC020468 TaxID=3154488 RepID=UPI0033C0F5FD
METPGLRERKKLATRSALSAAALRLAAERGPDQVRVEEIAAAADVSPRTYNNYFASREDAICAALGAERALSAGAAVRARPAAESPGTAVLAALTGEYARARLGPDMVALVTSSAALRAAYLRAVAVLDGPLAEALAARLGVPVDLPVRSLAAAVSGAVRVAVEQWLDDDGAADLHVLVATCVRHLLPALDTLGAP